MLDSIVVEKLKERYACLHPLLFHRSKERAKSNGDLFDILDTIPTKYPLVWCNDSRRWITSTNLHLHEDFLKR